MTSGKSKLDRIDDFMIEEILATPDEEILAEVSEEEIAAAQSALDKARQSVGKMRLAKAQAEVAASRKSPSVIPLDRVRAQSNLKQMITDDPALRGKLTLAARNADGSSGDDDEGLLEDLAELLGKDDLPDKR